MHQPIFFSLLFVVLCRLIPRHAFFGGCVSWIVNRARKAGISGLSCIFALVGVYMYRLECTAFSIKVAFLFVYMGYCFCW